MKLLIDTNIILDALLERKPWAYAAQKILLAIAEEAAYGCITASSLTDLHYLLRKYLHNNEKTRQVLLGLLESIDVLDVTKSDCQKAFDLPMVDYEDALLAYCALRHKVDLIVTRNPRHFEHSPVKPISPEDLLKKL
ncbi:MAG: PIN domain-containing protein [Lachnospiraceae bacterium]|jgi:predicted nucleic acid-binding protein|nr:PIN domain-containing protein [Lachnospiraceae bacterium]